MYTNKTRVGREWAFDRDLSEWTARTFRVRNLRGVLAQRPPHLLVTNHALIIVTENCEPNSGLRASCE